LSGCVGAIDGLAVRIAEPRGIEIPNPSSYYNRKGFFAIVVQVTCDASYRFSFISAIAPGSTHDSVAFRISVLYDILKAGALAPGYWIAGDDAYVCGKPANSHTQGEISVRPRTVSTIGNLVRVHSSSNRLEYLSVDGVFYGVHCGPRLPSQHS
jgi:hypothetical protein